MWLFATRSKIESPLTRSSDPCNPPVKLIPTPFMGKIKRSVKDQGIRHPLPNLAGRDSVHEQTLFPKPKEISCKRSSDERNPSQSCSYENTREIHAVQTSDFCKSSSRNTSSDPDRRTETETCPLRGTFRSSARPGPFHYGPFFPCVLGIDDCFFLGFVERRSGEPTPIVKIFNVGLLMKKTHTAMKKLTTPQNFAHFKPTDNHAQDTHSMHHIIICLKYHMCTSILRALWCDLQRNSSSLEKWPPTAWQQEDHGGAWSAAVDNEAVVAVAAWVRRLKACVAAKGVFFSSSTDMADRFVPLKNTAQNTSSTRI